jgi:hypothetical protein
VSGANFGWNFYHWGAGLVVIARIRDIEDNVLPPSLQTGSSSSPIFFLIAILYEMLIRNLLSTH